MVAYLVVAALGALVAGLAGYFWHRSVKTEAMLDLSTAVAERIADHLDAVKANQDLRLLEIKRRLEENLHNPTIDARKELIAKVNAARAELTRR